MIVVDSGPLISLINRAEGRLTQIAGLVLEDDPRDVVVPWPVFTEVDLFLRRKGYREGAQAFAEGLLGGEMQLASVQDSEFALATRLLRRYGDIDLDLPDAAVIAMAWSRSASAFTWDFRHFRAVVVERGLTIPLIVQEHQIHGRR